jgi:hypothetical protein
MTLDDTRPLLIQGEQKIHALLFLEAEKTFFSALPIARCPYLEQHASLSFGDMNVKCVHCAAFHWLDERLKESTTSAPLFSRCCHRGKVHLDNLPHPPQRLLSLFTDQTSKSREFREHIWGYNSALAFTSFTAKEQDVNSGGRGPWVWKSGHTIYHRVANVLPQAERNPTYAELYFYDPDDALAYRMDNNEHLQRDTMNDLQNMLLETNRYKKLYQHSIAILQNMPSVDLQICIVADLSTDLRQYNAPNVDEIAVILPGEQSQAVDPRDIILHQREGGLRFIHDHHHAYAPLHYVLLFPYGSAGWTYGMLLQKNTDNTPHDNEHGDHGRNDKSISQVQFYCYWLHTQENEFPIIQSGGHLF